MVHADPAAPLVLQTQMKVKPSFFLFVLFRLPSFYLRSQTLCVISILMKFSVLALIVFTTLLLVKTWNM